MDIPLILSRVSSSLTPLYRKTIPWVVAMFNVALVLASIFVFPRKYNDFYVGFCLISLIISTLAIYWSSLLRDVYFDSDYLFICKAAVRKQIPLRDILDTYKFLNCYVVRYSVDGRLHNVILLADFVESITTLGLLNTAAIRSLKQAIFKAKQSSEFKVAD